MNFWVFLDRLLDRLPGWPNERGWVTFGLFAILAVLLQMSVSNPALWEVEVYKVIIQAVALTGILNMIVAFFFTANKGDEERVANTGKALDAITATANATAAATGGATSDDVIREGDNVSITKD